MFKYIYNWWYAIKEEETKKEEVKPLPPLENSTN
tara:strand:+ start:466 stop:567 length:102 start_codon:yes stop_codon:yes gene_type:complete